MKIGNIVIPLIIAIGLLNSCGEKEKGGLLWEISGNGLEKPSYLFGTWHGDAELRNASFLDSVPGFHRAFDSVEQFMWEGYYKSADMSHLLLPKDTAYADLLSEEEITKLDSVLLKKIKVTSSQMNLKPGMLSLVLSQLETHQKVEKRLRDSVKELEQSDLSQEDSSFIEKRKQIYAERDVMDAQLTKRGQRENLPIVSLDSIIKFNLSLSSELEKNKSLAEQAKDLVKGLNSMDSLMNAVEEMTFPMRQAYRNQDIDEVGKHKKEQLKASYSEEFTEEDAERLMKQILVDRNKDWMKHIPALIADKPSFIAVGAVHLPGGDGLITLLREAGYTVKPVTK